MRTTRLALVECLGAKLPWGEEKGRYKAARDTVCAGRTTHDLAMYLVLVVNYLVGGDEILEVRRHG